jgi:uncharacterized cupredoxin-like copper-binding protein
MRRPVRLAAVVFLVASCAWALAACGGGGGGGSSFKEPTGPAVGKITIDSGNLFFKPDKITVDKPGIYDVELKNTQSGTHTLVFDDVKGFELEVTGDGSTDAKKVDLSAGKHKFHCTIPGHAAAGMKGTLTVK